MTASQPAPVTPWLAAMAVIAWALGAAVSTKLGVWIGLGCTAVVLGAAVSAREWTYLRHLLQPRLKAALAGALVGGVMTVATDFLYLPISTAVPWVARDVAYLYGKLGTLGTPGTSGATSYWYLSLVLLPVVLGEELVWRGLVQGALARRYGALGSVPLAASLYALAHAPVGSPVLVAAALLCGLVWGGLRAVTGSLVAPLIAHLLWDDMVLFISPVLPR